MPPPSATNRDIRAFIAVRLPQASNRRLQPFVEALAGAATPAAVRWVAPANRHITLTFLGRTRAAQIPALLDLLSSLGQTTAPLQVQLDRICRFPHAGSAVIAATVRPATALSALSEQVQAGCEALGFQRDRRPFRPHITLGRIRQRSYRDTPAVKLDLPLTVADITLLQSTTTAAGSRYLPLGDTPLAAPEASTSARAASMPGKRNSNPDSNATSG